MPIFPKTKILRHRRENLKKCSLQGLESRNDFIFYRYPDETVKDLEEYILLSVDAPPLTIEDSFSGLFILDATWRYAEKMRKGYENVSRLRFRSIPSHFRTAYPRRQEDCIDPEKGLASIEAIFISYLILGRETNGLLDRYYWKQEFLQKNKLLEFYDKCH